MLKSKKVLVLLAFLTFLVVAGFVAYSQGIKSPRVLDIAIFVLIIVVAGFAIANSIRISRDERKGFPVDDEFSDRLKYKAGFYAFQTSMYIWLFIFLFRSLIPDFETALGGGILLSAFSFYLIKYILRRELSEE